MKAYVILEELFYPEREIYARRVVFTEGRAKEAVKDCQIEVYIEAVQDYYAMPLVKQQRISEKQYVEQEENKHSFYYEECPADDLEIEIPSNSGIITIRGTFTARGSA